MVRGGSGGGLRPAARRDHPVADVHGDDERVAELRDRPVEEDAVERRRADHHAVGAGSQRRLDRRERPVAAADLDREARRRREALEERGRGGAVERAVEVDHVEPRRALVAVPPGERLGIAALERDGLAPSLGEPHDAAGEHVDRGQHLEATC